MSLNRDVFEWNSILSLVTSFFIIFGFTSSLDYNFFILYIKNKTTWFIIIIAIIYYIFISPLISFSIAKGFNLDDHLILSFIITVSSPINYIVSFYDFISYGNMSLSILLIIITSILSFASYPININIYHSNINNTHIINDKFNYVFEYIGIYVGLIVIAFIVGLFVISKKYNNNNDIKIILLFISFISVFIELIKSIWDYFVYIDTELPNNNNGTIYVVSILVILINYFLSLGIIFLLIKFPKYFESNIINRFRTEITYSISIPIPNTILSTVIINQNIINQYINPSIKVALFYRIFNYLVSFIIIAIYVFAINCQRKDKLGILQYITYI